MALLTGWGRSTWGSGTFGEALPVTVTGVSAASATGSETVVTTASITVEVTSVVAQGKTGSVGKGAAFSVTGVSASTAIERPNVWSSIGTASGTIWTDIAA